MTADQITSGWNSRFQSPIGGSAYLIGTEPETAIPTTGRRLGRAQLCAIPKRFRLKRGQAVMDPRPTTLDDSYASRAGHGPLVMTVALPVCLPASRDIAMRPVPSGRRRNSRNAGCRGVAVP